MRAPIRIQTWAGFALAVCLSACAASNPTRVAEPAPWEPKPKPAATSTATTPNTTQPNTTQPSATQPKASTDTAATDAPATSAAGSAPAPDAAASKATKSPEPKADADTKDASAAAASTASAKGTVRAEEPIVARVAGDPVYVSELFEQIMYTDTLAMLQYLERVVMGRLVHMEAMRLRVRLDPDMDSRAYEDAVKAIEAQNAKRFPNMTLDRFVTRVYGLDPIKYRERLRQDTRDSLLLERAARAWLLGQDHVDLHIIIVESEDEVKAVQKDLAAGMDFEEVARKRSIDPSKKEGGLIASRIRTDTPLGKLAFETAPGKVGGPAADAGDWIFVRVDAMQKALEGDWARLGTTVEESLKVRNIDPLEIQQWRAAMLNRYEIEIRPFLDLVREPGR